LLNLGLLVAERKPARSTAVGKECLEPMLLLL
jgi:hypothetical protein